MIEKIYSFIKENRLLSEGDTVVCGFSGGADSTGLLLSLYKLRERLSINIEAIHVNHCLRGEESDRDERFCADLCERLNIPFNAVSCNVREYAKLHSLSDEEAARKLRYGIFEKYSVGKKIATAHNANDNLETVILNISRGTALKGIAGIPVKRGNIIRPLLAVSRNEIESFLFAEKQNFVTDSTNLSDDYTRNKIRHKIIPLISELNSSAVETSVRSLSVLRDENELIESETDTAYEKCRNGNKLTGLSQYHRVIRRRCISRLLSENGLPYSSQRLEESDNILVNGGKINVSKDLYLISDGNSLELSCIVKETEQEYTEKDLVIGENQIYDDKTLICELIECDNLKKNVLVNKKLTFYVADYDKIIGRAVVRKRKFGDKIQLKGRNFTSSVKKLINETVPSEKRSKLHFIEDEHGTVFAECIGIAQRVAPDENTVRFLKISVK
ncbi:MAG: tRNA lysidine(34) synthetase TilS [Ruminococcus sp.]|nr:tRNA lysidine(34) synthetase TilS [Ruminococcus sp.]